MTQIFDADNQVIPITLIQAGPCFVTQKRSKDKDGYVAVQIGYEEVKKEKKLAKAQRGHLAKASVKNLKHLKEFKIDSSEQEYEIGAEIKADIFTSGDRIKIIGTSKGKGFAGVVKRHHFGGGPASHGQKHSLRAPGSIGATFPERVPKGRRMAGRMGGERSTVEGSEIVKVDVENNIIAVKGAVPGNRGSLVLIQTV